MPFVRPFAPACQNRQAFVAKPGRSDHGICQAFRRPRGRGVPEQPYASGSNPGQGAHKMCARTRTQTRTNTRSDAVLFPCPSEFDEALSFLEFGAV